MKEVITIKKGYRSYPRMLLFLGLALFLFACNQVQPPVNGPVTVLTIEASDTVAAAELRLQYDPAYFEFIEVVRQPGQSSILAEAYADGQGNVTIGLVSTSPTSGQVLDVVFREVQPNGSIDVQRIRAFDGNGVETQAVTTSLRQGQGPVANQTYDVQAQLEALSATIGTLAVPGEPELDVSFVNYSLGDITKSNDIDVLDVLQVLNISTGSNSSPSAYELYHADLNSDGEVDVQDVLTLLKKAVDPTLEASLQVAPRRVSFAYIQEQKPILVGNAGNTPLPTLEVIPSPSNTMSLKSAGGSQGKAYTVEVNVSAGWKNGTAVFRAGSAGEEQVLIGNIALLIAGQSNASGYGLPLTNKESGVPQVRMLGNDYVWKQAEEPLDDPTGQQDLISRDTLVGHSFGVRLGKRLAEATERYIYLIPSAMGGTGTREWLPTDRLNRGTLFGSANYRAKTSAGLAPNPPVRAEGGPVTAIVWYQGENDRHENTQSGFITRTNTIMNAFRQELHNPAVLYVQLGARLQASGETGDTPNREYQVIREFQRQMETNFGVPGTARPEFYLVVAHDLPMSDHNHLSALGQRILGERIALAYRQHVAGEDVNGTGPRLVSVTRPSSTTIKVKTNRAINQSTHYEGYFTVFDGGNPLPAGSISLQRDPADTTAVLITLSTTPTGTVTVRYMPPIGRALYGTEPLTDVVKDADGLPLPAFGPVVAVN
jgi:lysophospholipase L1-like esterase